MAVLFPQLGRRRKWQWLEGGLAGRVSSSRFSRRVFLGLEKVSVAIHCQPSCPCLPDF